MQETERIVHTNIDFIPLTSYTNITNGNSLEMDWKDVIPKKELNYIIGNPPFLGYSMMNKKQKDDAVKCFDKGSKSIKKLDYVCAWFMKATKYINNSNIEVAFVSTNSITQGE